MICEEQKMIKYHYSIEQEKNGLHALIIKYGPDIINIVNGFKTYEEAQFYADAYIIGYKDARGEI